MDPLTSLLTHREWPEYQAGLVAADLTEEINCILFDIDGLIWLNDQFGHEHGDMVIAKLAIWLAEQILNYQSTQVGESVIQSQLFRVGGDEFLLCLKGLRLDLAISLAKEIVKSCEGLQLPYRRLDNPRDFLALNAVVFPLSGHLDIAQLRNRASDAIYQQKLAQNQFFSVVAVLEAMPIEGPQ